MPPDKIPKMSTKEEEISFLKERIASLELKLAETEKDFDEFREDSSSIEKELEKSLEFAEKNVSDLRTRCNLLTFELDTSREREAELRKQNSDLLTEIAKYRDGEQKFVNYIRDLEQKNDDIERCHRQVMGTLDDIQAQLNSQIEKNALLETELDQKDELHTVVQRLKDERRDLQQELDRQIRKFSDNNHIFDSAVDSNKLMDIQTTPTTPVKSSLSMGQLSPPTRTSAINLVGDLLRKVGSLESKLAASRVSKEPRESPNRENLRTRNQRLHRGPSSPTLSAVKL